MFDNVKSILNLEPKVYFDLEMLLYYKRKYKISNKEDLNICKVLKV